MVGGDRRLVDGLVIELWARYRRLLPLVAGLEQLSLLGIYVNIYVMMILNVSFIICYFFTVKFLWLINYTDIQISSLTK